MKITSSHILLTIIVVVVLLGSIVSADSEYCTAPPSGITTDIETNGNWTNVTITLPDCYVCIDYGYGAVDCSACSSGVFTSNVTCGVIPFAVQFNESSNDPAITDYYWSFGDGNTSTIKNPVNNYTYPGYFTINHSITTPNATTWTNFTNYITSKTIGDSCVPAGSTSGGGGGGQTTTGGESMALVFGLIGGMAVALIFLARR